MIGCQKKLPHECCCHFSLHFEQPLCTVLNRHLLGHHLKPNSELYPTWCKNVPATILPLSTAAPPLFPGKGNELNESGEERERERERERVNAFPTINGKCCRRRRSISPSLPSLWTNGETLTFGTLKNVTLLITLWGVQPHS